MHSLLFTGSKDPTALSTLAASSDVRVVRMTETAEVGEARNHCAAESVAEYVVYTDAGDVWVCVLVGVDVGT
jgi:hypothetical protein